MKKTSLYIWRLTKFFSFFVLTSFLLFGCGENTSIVNRIDEREANEILVFLAAHGIDGEKASAGETEAGGSGQLQWNIMVDKNQTLEAMALLNRNGLPRRKGTSLLELFAKSGLMTSDKEETIRYQAGIEEELKNTIRMIDGVLDAEVQISFPSTEGLIPGQEKQIVKAAIYVKHQGVFDDPNNHLESKIKRLAAGSIDGLDYESVSVIPDRSRFADIDLSPEAEIFSTKAKEKEYVSIWSMTMSKKSSARFRMIFGLMIFFILLFGGGIVWLIYKFYPQLQKKKFFKKKEEENPKTGS